MTETHVVISRYNESVDWVKDLQYPYTIYNKGMDDINYPNIKLSNIGRESGTYIYHIIQNYNNINDYTIFLQAMPFEHCGNLLEKIKNYNRDELTLLADGILPNNLCVVPEDHRLGVEKIVNKLGLHDYLKNYITPQYDYPFGSQWIIPKKYIINKSLKFWIDLYEIHQSIFESPWVLERMFLHVFRYSDKT